MTKPTKKQEDDLMQKFRDWDRKNYIDNLLQLSSEDLRVISEIERVLPQNISVSHFLMLTSIIKNRLYYDKTNH